MNKKKISKEILDKKITKKLKFIKLIFFLFIIISYFIFVFNKFKKKLDVCLCVIGKKENKYIKEFVEHYKNIGYNKIFIYDNNDINEERFEYVIQKEVNQGFVYITNYRGCMNCQVRSYKDCYKKNNNKYDWLSFF